MFPPPTATRGVVALSGAVGLLVVLPVLVVAVIFVSFVVVLLLCSSSIEAIAVCVNNKAGAAIDAIMRIIVATTAMEPAYNVIFIENSRGRLHLRDHLETYQAISNTKKSTSPRGSLRQVLNTLVCNKLTPTTYLAGTSNKQKTSFNGIEQTGF